MAAAVYIDSGKVSVVRWGPWWGWQREKSEWVGYQGQEGWCIACGR
jgi:hypothetical protein